MKTGATPASGATQETCRTTKTRAFTVSVLKGQRSMLSEGKNQQNTASPRSSRTAPSLLREAALDKVSCPDASARLVELTAQIVAAYLSHNTIEPGDLPRVIQETHASLLRATNSGHAPERDEQKPKVPIKKSVSAERIFCLECGRGFRSIKRHLDSYHGLSPEQYREKWVLNHEYPMVAPNYSKARSALAKQTGLGTRRADD